MHSYTQLKDKASPAGNLFTVARSNNPWDTVSLTNVWPMKVDPRSNLTISKDSQARRPWASTGWFLNPKVPELMNSKKWALSRLGYPHLTLKEGSQVKISPHQRQTPSQRLSMGFVWEHQHTGSSTSQVISTFMCGYPCLTLNKGPKVTSDHNISTANISWKGDFTYRRLLRPLKC